MSHRAGEIAVTLQPLGKTVHVLPGTTLLEAVDRGGLAVDIPCGGVGTCGKCQVIVRRGVPAPTPAEQQRLSPQQLAEGLRLACQTTVAGPMTVEVPETSQLASMYKILAEAQATGEAHLDPAVRKQYLRLEPPARGNDAADLRRLEAALGRFDIDRELLAELPARLRAGAFCGTAVLLDHRLIDFEPGDTTRQSFAVAVDVGTTTLAAALMDLATGRTLRVASRLNPQTSFGDDVLTRILHARTAEGLRQLQARLAAALNEMIAEVAAEAGIAPAAIYEVTLAGNTAMQTLACGIDPQPLGTVPFVAALGRSYALPAADLGLAIHPRGRAVVLPVIGGFVGGDTVAGMLATRLAESDGPTLLIDIGTNGEIVLAHDGRLWAASTAAGPAFEGARILHGMRGASGAIEKVVVDGDLRYNVIGDVPPLGLCGSGLIDLAAELLRQGLVSPEGRLVTAADAPPEVPCTLQRRLTTHEGRPAFIVAPAEETAAGRAIALTQRDVRELQLATGAIRAGIEILLRQAGLDVNDLATVLVAGGFGNYIRRENAQRIGLLPHGLPAERIRYQGNTALAGAQWVALSQQSRTWADELAARAEHVDLGYCPGFQEAFADAMIFPER